MKKLAALVACSIIMAAATAHAEHKLLITDVLDAKQVEAQAGYEYTHAWGVVDANNNEGKVSVGAGLGHGLEISVAVPFASERVSDEGKRVGWGDVSFGAKYRLIDEKPVTLVVGTDVKFDTAGGHGPGTRTTTVTPYLAASKDLGEELKPYVAYLPTFQVDDKVRTRFVGHTFRVGVEKEVTHNVTLDAKADVTFVGAQGAEPGEGRFSNAMDHGSFMDYTFELGAYLQVAKNFYVIPSVSAFTERLKDENLTGTKTGVSLYVLF